MPKSGPVLLLAWNPYRGDLRPAVAQHLDAVAAAVPKEALVVVNAVGGVSPALRRLRPSAVILHTTFLGTRWLRPFEAWRARSRWLADLDVPKIALPQDDYDHAEILDEWLVELGITSVLTPLSEHQELYPRVRAGARVEAALTGYVDERAARSFASTPPLRERPYDVVYRATSLPYWYGSLGQLKRSVGEAARDAAASRGWRSDISLSEVLTGDNWFRHLASGRVVVGAESGSSVLDRRGEVRRRIVHLLAEHPSASFAEVSSHMPAGWDSGRFTALSPRHLEAAMMRTAQVLVRGEYSGVLEPGRHYVPVRPDLADLKDAIEQALDPASASALVEASHEDLVASGRYSYRRLTEQVRATLPQEIGSVSVGARLMLAPLRASAALRLLARSRGGATTD